MFDVSYENEIALFSMQHGKVNAMDLEFCVEYTQRLQALENSQDCRAVIITGREKVFSAGVDLIRLVEEDEAYLDQFLPALTTMFKVTFGFSKPLVGLVGGHAIAGGCVLACACDYRIAHPQSRIGIPELRVGVPFPTSGMEIMRFTASSNSFRQIVNNGQTFQGEGVLAAGLADEVLDPLESLARGRQIASELSAIPAKVFAHTKRHVRSIAWQRIEAGEKAFEPEVYALWRTPEVRSNIKAYVERTLTKTR